MDRLVAELQKALEEQAQALYSPQVLELARRPKNMGAMLDPDAAAIVRGPCGDTMGIYLRLSDSRIDLAAFMTDGCGPTVACGSMLTTMVKGLTLEEADRIEAEDLMLALGGLPAENEHCALLAVNTLRQAIAHHRPEDETGFR